MQHGDVRVLAPLNAVIVTTLKLKFGPLPKPDDTVQLCRELCYADVHCSSWQVLEERGCLAEDLSSGHVAPYPLSRTSAGVAMGEVVDGEFLQHWCAADLSTTSTTTTLRFRFLPDAELVLGDRVELPVGKRACSSLPVPSARATGSGEFCGCSGLGHWGVLTLALSGTLLRKDRVCGVLEVQLDTGQLLELAPGGLRRLPRATAAPRGRRPRSLAQILSALTAACLLFVLSAWLHGWWRAAAVERSRPALE